MSLVRQPYGFKYDSMWGRYSYRPSYKEKKNEPPPHPITQLLPEVLEHVFSHLDVRSKGRVARVCRAWRDVVYQSSLWTDMEANVDLKKTVSNGELQRSFVRRGIRKIKPHFCAPLIVGLEYFCDHLADWPHLQSLDLSENHYMDADVASDLFKREMTELTKLKLSYFDSMPDAHFELIVTSTKTLVDLDLTLCQELTDASLKSVTVHLSSLKRLNLQCCTGLTDAGIGYLCGCNSRYDTGHDHLALEFLGLSECEWLTLLGLYYLGRGQRTLKSLELGTSWARDAETTDAGLRHLAKLTALTELYVCGLYEKRDYLDDVRLLKLVGGKKLKKFGLQGWCSGESGLIIVVDEFSSITWLDISNSVLVTDDALQQVAKLQKLRYLNIMGSSAGDLGLFHLAADGKSNIGSLLLTSCVNITDDGMAHLSTMPHLHELGLHGCSNITKKGLINLSRGKAIIDDLQLSNCPSIGPDGRALVLKGLFPLRELAIDKYENLFGPDWLTLASRHLRDLRVFYLYDVVTEEYSSKIDCLFKIWRDEVSNGPFRVLCRRIIYFRKPKFAWRFRFRS